MSRRAVSLIGKKFGLLTVKSRCYYKKDGGQIRWKCECDCGNTYIAQGRYLKSGATKSCGCLQKGRKQQEEMKRNEMWKGSETLDALNLKDDPYRNLANAIIAVAVDDYKAALIGESAPLQQSLEEFFFSDWFSILTNIDPNRLIGYIKDERAGVLKAVNA